MNGTCVAMPTDGTESLCDVVNECIQELNASGQIEAWYAQYEAAAKASASNKPPGERHKSRI